MVTCHLLDPGGRGRRSAVVAWRAAGSSTATPAFDGSTAYFIGTDHTVVAVDAATGQVRWRRPTGTMTGPTALTTCRIVGALVACGDSGIVAFQRTDGTPAWRYDVSNDAPGRFPFVSNNDILFAGSYGQGSVYAIDAASGDQRWVAPVLAFDSVGVNIPDVAIDGDMVAAVFVRGTRPQTGGVIALDSQTGSVRWRTNFSLASPDSNSGGISVVVWGPTVVASSNDGRLYLLDRLTGAIRSFFPGVGNIAPGLGLPGVRVGQDFRHLAVSGSTLFASSLSGWFVAYDLANHVELWRVADPEGAANTSSIATDSDAVYINHFNGRLAAFSAHGPAFLWDVGSYQDPFAAGPTVGFDKIFVAGLTGFWAIDK